MGGLLLLYPHYIYIYTQYMYTHIETLLSNPQKSRGEFSWTDLDSPALHGTLPQRSAPTSASARAKGRNLNVKLRNMCIDHLE